MEPIVVFDSKEKSMLEIKNKVYDLQEKYGSNLNQLEGKVANNQELETDELIDDLMLWRALDLSSEEKGKGKITIYLEQKQFAMAK